MSLSYNHVTLAGNLTRKPELRQTSKNPVVHFAIAINRRWRNADGETQEEATFVECEAWARTAEFIAQYFDKGSPIFVTGRLKYETWEDKDGQRRSRLKVNCTNAQFCGGRRPGGDGADDEDAEDGRDQEAAPRRKALAASRRSAAKVAEADDEEFPVEDPPF